MNGPRNTMFAIAGQLRRVLALSTMMVLVTLVWAGAAKAETFTVTNTDNSGADSLRDAITRANTRAGADEIVFADGVSGTIMLSSTLPPITDPKGLVMDGGGHVTVSGNHAVGVFHTYSADGGASWGSLTLKNLTVADGTGFHSFNSSWGGGILNEGTLEVTNVTLSGNHADYGGGIYGEMFSTTTVTRSTFSNNSAVGGGALRSGGEFKVTDSTFSENHAELGGGAIVAENLDPATITNSTFSGNSTGSDNFAGRGGAIANDSLGPLRVTNSTFSGNNSTYIGGAIANSSYRRMTVVHSTFSGNAAGVLLEDGAIFSDEGGAIFNDGPATLRNTIVADSPAGGNCAGQPLVVDGSYNVSDDGTCGFAEATGSLPNTDPLLDTVSLQDNGGPTKTIALQPNSPAVDLVAQEACPPPETDQRGVARPQGAACDSGSFELRREPPQPPECTIKGTPGDDFLEGTSANDRICARGGNDIVVDHEGSNDILLGHGGRDVLLDVKGKGLLKGGDANDVLFALDDAPLDTMNGQHGSDDLCLGDDADVRKNCERGSVLGLSVEERERLSEAKEAAGL